MLFGRNLNIKKLFNIAKVELSRMNKSEYVRGMPYFVFIDPTNICNLRCPLCITGSGKSSRYKGKMDFELYKKVIDQITEYVLHVFLYNWGEPLLLENIHQFVRYAKLNGISISISSNLNINLNRSQAEGLILAGLDRLIVSCDGHDQNSYEKYRHGGNFEKVLTNVRLLLDVERQLNTNKPYIEWQYLLTYQNEAFVERERLIAKKLGIKIFSVCPVILPFNWPKEEFRNWLPSGVFANEYPNVSAGDLCDPCWWLWRSVVINWDGTVSPCCYIDDKSEDFGNLGENPLSAIWNGNQYRTARRLFRRQKAESIICSKCDVFKYCCSKHYQVMKIE